VSLEDLWAAIARAQDERGARCLRAGGCDGTCCDLARVGFAPSVTPAERARIEAFLRERGLPVPPWKGTTCRFLDAGRRCSIYPVRPTGCRVFLCGAGDYRPLIVDAVGRLYLDWMARHVDEVRAAQYLPDVTFSPESH
jgi:Fe-S-cluster containining protein